jgi:molecular chaperone GrpE
MSEDVGNRDVNDITSDLPEDTEEADAFEVDVDASDEDINDSDEGINEPEALEVEVETEPSDNDCDGASKVSSRELPSLKEKLNEKSAQLLRLAADFDNFKKRQRKDTQLQVQNFAEKLMKGLLPVLDSMDRAKETVDEGEDIEHLREGFIQIFNLFHKALKDSGVTSMEVLGHPFDPRFHEALMHHPAEGVEPGSVTVELQKGWMMGDRVIRAARVGVAPDAPSIPEPAEDPSDEAVGDPEDFDENGESVETDDCCDGGCCDGACGGGDGADECSDSVDSDDEADEDDADEAYEDDVDEAYDDAEEPYDEDEEPDETVHRKAN